MDDADLTAERTERETAALIAAARVQVSGAAMMFPACRYCDEVLTGERQAAGFCSSDCRDDFEKARAADLRAGRIGRQ